MKWPELKSRGTLSANKCVWVFAGFSAMIWDQSNVHLQGNLWWKLGELDLNLIKDNLSLDITRISLIVTGKNMD